MRLEKLLITVFLVALLAISMALPATAENSIMVDRPDGLLEVAEQMTTDLINTKQQQTKMAAEIQKRSAHLDEINERLEETRDPAKRMNLQAQRNVIEKEEIRFRKSQIGLLKKQMDQASESLVKMKAALQDELVDEIQVDDETRTAFNHYFRTSAQLIVASVDPTKTDPRCVEMLKELEERVFISDQSNAFIQHAISTISEFQKALALLDAKLTVADSGLEEYGKRLDHEQKGIIISSTLAALNDLFSSIDISGTKESIFQGLTRNPNDSLKVERPENVKTLRESHKQSLGRYLKGSTFN